MKRQQAVSLKINKYLLKADELYQTYLTRSDGQQTWNRWGVSRVLCFRKYHCLFTTITVLFTRACYMTAVAIAHVHACEVA